MGIDKDYHRTVGEGAKPAPGFSTSYGLMNQWVSLSELGTLTNTHEQRPSGSQVFRQAPTRTGIGAEFTPPSLLYVRSRKQIHPDGSSSLKAVPPPPAEGLRYLPARPTSASYEPAASSQLHHQDVDQIPPHLRITKSGGYDDFHKAFLKIQKSGVVPSYPYYGPPRLRQGRQGSSWRHVKEVMQARGERTVFVDGHPRCNDSNRLLYRDVTGGNTIQPSVKARPLSASQQQQYKYRYLIDPELTAFKGTESGNWSIVR